MEFPKLKDKRVLSILEGLKVVRNLYVSTIIIGEKFTGRYSLVKEIFPNTLCVSGKEDPLALKEVLNREDEIIIIDFEYIKDPLSLDFEHKRVIAIADKSVDKRVIDEKFAFIYNIPSLKERPEDIEVLKEYFLAKAKDDFMVEVDLKIPKEKLDISQNIKSLKSSIYKEVLLASLIPREIEEALYRYFLENLEGYNAYRENLGILERPMLRAGLKKFGSQLRLSEILGINRNTLRKKLNEYGID
jgi:DNA-binding protein Fis